MRESDTKVYMMMIYGINVCSLHLIEWTISSDSIRQIKYAVHILSVSYITANHATSEYRCKQLQHRFAVRLDESYLERGTGAEVGVLLQEILGVTAQGSRLLLH